MEDNRFNNNLAAIDSIFWNKTFQYRINGFAYACGIEDLEVTPNSRVIEKKDDNYDYHIETKHNYDDEYELVILKGHYDDLNFNFVNLLKPSTRVRLHQEVVDLKFGLLMTKEVDDCIYKLDVLPRNGRYVFVVGNIGKDGQLSNDIVFHARVSNFKNVLEFIQLFVSDPVLLYERYDDIVLNDSNGFIQGNVLKNIVTPDATLEKPRVKLLQRIRNYF